MFSKKHFTIIVFVLGALIVVGGFYFLLREKSIPDGGVVVSEEPTQESNGDITKVYKGDDGVKITAVYNPTQWDQQSYFLISFESSSFDFRQFNFARNTVIVDANGKEYTPAKAEGNGFGEGKYFTLSSSFDTNKPIKLVIRDIGEVKERMIQLR
ncbi:MAG: hypothetical protein HYW78_02380 [Parcubacteria group bacterium]|nr:hypothetical protein [Parcubacteria group bacterium]